MTGALISVDLDEVPGRVGDVLSPPGGQFELAG